MDDRLYPFLKATAIVLTLAWVGWSLYDWLLADRAPGLSDYAAANRAFDDGQYETARRLYAQAFQRNPELLDALRGEARALLQLGRPAQAIGLLDAAIARDPDFAGAWANRGIAHDRLGQYRAALADYEHAMQLDARVAEGPGWLTRFLRGQAEKPPTIADRARYLRQQLALPAEQRVLRVPALDAAQRPYRK